MCNLSRLSNTAYYMPGVIDEVELSKIKPSYHMVRTEVGNIQELSFSICSNGLLNPIIVRTHQGDFFEIVAGNRRFQACKKLGWRKIPCHILELDDKEAFELSLMENIQRNNLHPLDEARAFKAYVSNFGWGGVSELAKRLGKSTSYVTKRIRLLDLPSDVVDSISSCSIDTSVAEELFYVKDKSQQSQLAQMISERHLSLRKVRELLKDDESNFSNEVSQSYSSYDRYKERTFEKSILALRVALNKLGSIIGSIEEDWVMYEIMMQHKNMLHNQIDILIKEKKRYYLNSQQK